MGNMLETATSDLARSVDELRRVDAQLTRRLVAQRQPNETDRAALRYISAAPADRPVTPGALASHLGVSTAAVTSVIRRLADRGMVVVAPHPDDARSKIVRPSTREVQPPVDDISRRIERLESEFSPEQVDVISRFLRRLAEELADSD
jgi:DNA-binding MarR family transcriptional regulator